MLSRTLLFIFLIFSTSNSFAVTCTGNDWIPQICNLPNLEGDRCANLSNFGRYCTKETVGCNNDPNICYGFNPPGHWYTLVDSTGTPIKKCRCGC